MKIVLKIIMKHSVARWCCCGGPPDIWREKPPKPAEYVSRVAERIRELERRYGNRLDMSVKDPSDLLSLWDVFRYRVRSDVPTWILEGKKVFEGIPDLDQLSNAIDAQLEKTFTVHTPNARKTGSLG
ncbi:MAG: hypothetical protein LBJ36_01275 [Synergistaceae bacterium]|jgi:hypothetical protein|nr:hypothetical protein [Synergistaceae bacterium]